MACSVIIKSENIQVEISSFGAEIQSVKSSNGTEYMWNGDEEVWGERAPVLFPICGGLKEGKYIYKGKEYFMPKHGFAKKMEFEVEKQSESSVVFLLKSTAQTLEVYPFEFEFRIKYEVLKNKLGITVSVKNMKNTPMYFSHGAHEGYSCPEGIEEYDVIFEETETLNSHKVNGVLISDEVKCILKEGKRLSLKTELFERDSAVFMDLKSRSVTLSKRSGGKNIKVNFPDYPFFILWTKPGAKYICIEPWCGMADVEGSSYDFTEKKGIVKLDGNGEIDLFHSIEFN